MVVNDLLPPGFRHTSANVLNQLQEWGRYYELYGDSEREITDIRFKNS